VIPRRDNAAIWGPARLLPTTASTRPWQCSETLRQDAAPPLGLRPLERRSADRQGRREQPDRGLAGLMGPRRAAPGVPLVYRPLCWHPSARNINHCGTLTRWSHVNLRSRSIDSWIAPVGCQGHHPLAERLGSLVPRPRHPENRAAQALMPPNALDELKMPRAKFSISNTAFYPGLQSLFDVSTSRSLPVSTLMPNPFSSTRPPPGP
jgi:hypothetical protein